MIYFPRGDPHYYRKINGYQIRRLVLGPKINREMDDQKTQLISELCLTSFCLSIFTTSLIRIRFLTFGFVVKVMTVFVGSITVEKHLLFLTAASAALLMVCIIISLIENGCREVELD